MHFNTRFNIRVLLGVAACTMCWSVALADSADNGNATQVDASIHQNWLIEPMSQRSSNQSQANI